MASLYGTAKIMSGKPTVLPSKLHEEILENTSTLSLLLCYKIEKLKWDFCDMSTITQGQWSLTSVVLSSYFFCHTKKIYLVTVKLACIL